MIQEDVFALVLREFDRLEVRYMLCESLGAIAYGDYRLTNDFDFVVALAPAKAGEFYRAFTEAGFYCPQDTVILEELRRHGQFNLIHHETGLKVDCMILKLNDFAREEFSRRRLRQFTPAVAAVVAAPEDVILGKLIYYRMGGSEKHITDIQGMLRVSSDEMDFAYLEKWVKELGLTTEWNRAQKS